MWKNITPEEKLRWKDLTQKDKDRYEREIAEYGGEEGMK